MKAVNSRLGKYCRGARCISSDSRIAMAKLLHDILQHPNEFGYTELDFPDSYVDMAHPQDLIEAPEPVQPELWYHRSAGPAHYRLLLRASFRLSSDVYSPMTFLCDTRLSGGFYFSPDAMSALTNARRILLSDLQSPYIQTAAGKIPVSETQLYFQPANLLGLHALQKFGLIVAEKPTLVKPFEYF